MSIGNISLIICEETREEKAGSQSIIGVFPPGGIKLPVPGVLPKFGIFAVVDIKDSKPLNVTIEIISPKDQPVVKFENIEYPINEKATRAHLVMNISPLPIQLEGEYTVRIKIDGGLEFFIDSIEAEDED